MAGEPQLQHHVANHLCLDGTHLTTVIPTEACRFFLPIRFLRTGRHAQWRNLSSVFTNEAGTDSMKPVLPCFSNT
jgi:hypothetical protein